jgi:hypothetical protein
LYAFLLGSNVDEYLQITRMLLKLTAQSTRLFAAHSGTTPASLPLLEQQNFVDLEAALSLMAIAARKSAIIMRIVT